MATIRVRFLAQHPGAAGAFPRWFWQPTPAVRALGFDTRRVPSDWPRHDDAEQLRAAAIAEAEALNREVDAARAAGATPSRPRPVGPHTGATLGHLLSAWRASDHYQQLAETTRRGYLQNIRRLEAWGADAPLPAITPPRIQVLIRSLKRTPGVANAVARTLQSALAWGVREGWLASNPASRMNLEASDPSGLVWPREAVDAFVAKADAMGLHGVGDAVALNAWLGQREADVLRLPIAAYVGSADGHGQLVIRQRKTGAGVKLPIDMVPALKTRLAAALARSARLPVRPLTIIVSDETGRPFRADNFRHVFARVRAALAKDRPSWSVDYLPPGRDMTDPDAFTIRTQDLTFMHLRHTAVVRLAEGDVNNTGIGSITGHSQASIPTILKRYMVNTGNLARLAFGQRLAAEGRAVDAEKKEKQG